LKPLYQRIVENFEAKGGSRETLFCFVNVIRYGQQSVFQGKLVL
jgi:hypothetical protein